MSLLVKLLAEVHRYTDGPRGSGRTHALISSMNNGDLLLVHSQAFASTCKSMAESMGKVIETLVVSDLTHLRYKMSDGTLGKRSLFVDHHMEDILARQQVCNLKESLRSYRRGRR